MNIPNEIVKEIVAFLERAPDISTMGEECGCVIENEAGEDCMECCGTGREVDDMSLMGVLEDCQDGAEELLKKLKPYI